MKPENPTKKQSLSVEQMVTDAAHIRETLLERLVAAVSDVETERLEKLNELSTRCKEAYQLLDELVDQQNAGRLVRDSAFKFAYDNIKSASDDVDAFLSQTPEERSAQISESKAAEVEKNVENTVTVSTPPETAVIAEDKKVESRETQAHYLAQDVERLKSGDPRILYQNGESRQGLKDIEELRLDIEAIFEAAGRSDEFYRFYTTKFKTIAELIKVNAALYKKSEEGGDRVAIYKDALKSYRQILANASEWLNTEPSTDVADETETEDTSGVPAVIESETRVDGTTTTPKKKKKKKKKGVSNNVESEESIERPEGIQDQHVADKLYHELMKTEHEFLMADVPEGKNSTKKKLKDLEVDIRTLFAGRSVYDETVKQYFDVQYRIQEEEIGHFTRLILSEKDPAKVRDYQEAITDAYLQIQDDVRAIIAIATFTHEDRLNAMDEVGSTLERSIEEVKGDIDTARSYLDTLKERHANTEGFLLSEEYLLLAGVFGQIDADIERNADNLNQQLENYLSELWPMLDKLTDKFTLGMGDAEASQSDAENSERTRRKMLQLFRKYKLLPSEHPLKETEEYKEAAAESLKLMLMTESDDDSAEAKAERQLIIKTFKEHVKALHKKAVELGVQKDISDKSEEGDFAVIPNNDEKQQQVDESLKGVEVIEIDKISEDVQDLENNKLALLDEFEEYRNLPTESVLRTTDEFHQAAVYAAELRNHTLQADDIENSKLIRTSLIEKFALQLEVLREKANEPIQPDINLDELTPVAAASSPVDPTAPASLDAKPEFPEIKKQYQEALVLERGSRREKSLEAKLEFRDIKRQYHEALNAHYEAVKNEQNNRNMFAKIRSLGMKKDMPDLPEAVKALEAEYLARRKDYARELDAHLSLRGQKFELSQDDMKRAFARKFLIAPQKEILDMQERQYLSPEKKAILLKIAGGLAKNKWNIRIATVLLAGAVGAATGGTALAFAGAAGLKGAKIGFNIGAGVAGGALANVYTQKKVNETTENLNKKSEAFSLDSMDDIEASVLEANKAVLSAKKQQKIATVVAGGLAGLTTGVGTAVYENVTETAADRYNDAINNGLSTNKPPTPNSLSEGDLSKLETSKIVPQVVESADLPPQPAFVKEVALPFDSREGGLVYEHHVKDVSFGPEFKVAALTDAENKALSSFVRVKLDDILVKPNTPVPMIETKLQAAIEKSFGDSQWWKESPIKSVDIGKVEVVLVSGTETTPEIVKGEYIVQKGDTLWDIAEEKFAGQLKDLNPQERNEVLGRLFERVKADSGLMESLSLDSVNNIDLIKTGESIELDALQAELTQVLEDREIVEEFRKSAPLTVEADSDVKSVPISVVEKPIPGGTEVVINNERSYTEAAPTKPETTTPAKGFYETAPQHVRDEIRQYFNNPKAFAASVNNAAYKIDVRAYDFFDTLSNTYKSPYEFLGGKTLAEYAELEAKPNAELRAILAKQNIKYEAFLEWGDKIKELEKNIPHTKTDTISTMFEQSVFQDKVTEQDRVM